MSTPAVSITPTQQPFSDFRALGPWFIAVALHSYAVNLFSVSCYDFADKVLGAPTSTRLWLSAIWGLFYIFIAIFSGKYVVKFGARKFLFVMVPANIVALLLGLIVLHPAAQNVFVLFLLMIPLNIASSSCWPALETAVSRSPAKMPLSTRMALYNICWSTTGFVAFFTKGAFQEISWSLIFIIPAVITLLSCIVLFARAIPDSMMGQEHVPEEAHDEVELDTPEMRLRATTLLHMAWIGNALAYVASNVMIPVALTFAYAAWLNSYGYKPSLTLAAIVTSVWVFTRAVGFVLTMKCKFWHYKARWLVGSQIALAVSFLVMLTWHQPVVLILAQIIFGFAAALVYSSSLYYAMHTSDGSGEHAGFHEALIGVGFLLGPTIGALAAMRFGTDFESQKASLTYVAYAVTGILLVGIVVMSYLAVRRGGDRMRG